MADPDAKHNEPEDDKVIETQLPTSRQRFEEFKRRLKREHEKKKEEKRERREEKRREKERKRREESGLPPLADGASAGEGSGSASDAAEAKRSDAPAGEASRDKDKPKVGRKEYLKQFWDWLRPYRWGFFLLFLLSVIGTGTGLIQPLFGRHIVDNIILTEAIESHEKYMQVGVVVLLMVVVALFGQFTGIYRSYRMMLLNSKMMVRIRRRLFNKMVRLSLKSLTDMKVGGAISRLSNDVNAMGSLVQMAIITPGIAVIQLTATLAIVLTINWRLALAAMTVLPFMAVVSYWWIKKGRPMFKAVHEDRALVSGRLTETFSGIRVVRTFRREHKEEQDYTLGQHTIVRKSIFAHMRLLLIDMAWMLVMSGSGLLVISAGALLVIHDAGNPDLAAADRTTVGDIFAFQAYTFMVLRPVYMIINTLSQLQNTLASMERVMEILGQEIDKPDRPGAQPAPAAIEELEFDNVTFGYDPEKPVVHELNVKIKGRTTVALVGKSGAGKTTVTDLLARFHDPQSGCIRLNGVDLRDLKLATYRSLLGMVQQEVFLFDGTVRANIAYGMPHAADEAVIEAAKRANAHEFIVEFENGYDTVVGERGVKLSGGQRQRLSIARAFLANPKILILDEATSNLDTESEQLIQDSLKELMRDRNTFVIAHRLSTVTYADQIVVMDEGRIIETGTHRDLLDRKGAYYEMIERQRKLTL